MKLFNRKSQLHRLLDTADDWLPPRRRRFAMPSGLPSGRAPKIALPKNRAATAGLIAGGLAGLTAGSAGVSSLRRRKEGARDGS